MAQTAAAASATDWAQETEQRLLDAALPLAEVLGWTPALVRRAAKDCGLSNADAELLLPHGPRDLAALLAARHDAAALASLATVDPKTLKIRERIERAVEARLEASAADGAAARRLTGFLALPMNAPLGLRLLWTSADSLWRWAGDTATDENHYSKRAILAGILAAALPIRLHQDRDAARRFVLARVDNVMRFESWKAALPRSDLMAQAAGFLGQLRYRR